MRPFTRRRTLVFLGAVLLLAATPIAVLAAKGGFSGAVEHQASRWTTNDVTISGTAWHTLGALSITRCTRSQITETISATVSGGPVRFRGVIDDVPEALMRPGIARFVPNGIESFSYTFVGNTGPFEADDTHRFDIQWQSPTGASVTLLRGATNALFRNGVQGCP